MVLHPASRLQPHIIVSTCFVFACVAGAYYGVASCAEQAQKHQGRKQTYVSFGVAPSGRELVFSAQGTNSSNLFTLKLTNSQVSAVTVDAAFDQQPAFSPDGKHIVFAASETSEGAAHIFICPSGGGPRQQLTRVSCYDTSPSFSRDGTQIVFARAARKRPYSMGGWTWDQWDVFTMAADGSSLKRITSGQYYQLSSPVLSPDNKTVLFSMTHGTQVQRDVCIARTEGTSQPVMLTRDGHSSEASYSPKGDHIVFISDATINYDYELWMMKPDGSASLQLTHTGFYNREPRFTPDGRHLLFLSDPTRQLRYSLLQIDTNGANLRKIADSSLFDDPLKWRP